MHDYIFEWGKKTGKCCIALGYISMYNHSYKSNCEYFMNFEEETIQITGNKNNRKGGRANYQLQW
ncbi:MAG: hypothetical protein WKF59_14150 [Chitinophagaceae bacterium]